MTPATGPKEREPIIAGKSENSISRKPATLSCIILPITCRINAIAESKPILINTGELLWQLIGILYQPQPNIIR